jgi:hypothetical protein
MWWRKPRGTEARWARPPAALVTALSMVSPSWPHASNTHARVLSGSCCPFLSLHLVDGGASLGSTVPLLAQEVLELVHHLLRVEVIVTLWVRRLVHRRVIVLL